MFTDMYGNPMYGTIIWDVNQGEELLHPDYSIVQEWCWNRGSGS